MSRDFDDVSMMAHQMQITLQRKSQKSNFAFAHHQSKKRDQVGFSEKTAAFSKNFNFVSQLS